MTQVSKYPVREDIYKDIFEVFLETIAGLTTQKSVAAFFEEFLTPTERVMLAKRLSVGLLLGKGYNYREISELLRVSTTTVSSYSFYYKSGKGYRAVVDKILRNKKIEGFLLGLAEKITSVVAVPGPKTGSWRYLNEEIKKLRKSKRIAKYQ